MLRSYIGDGRVLKDNRNSNAQYTDASKDDPAACLEGNHISILSPNFVASTSLLLVFCEIQLGEDKIGRLYIGLCDSCLFTGIVGIFFFLSFCFINFGRISDGYIAIVRQEMKGQFGVIDYRINKKCSSLYTESKNAL